MFKVNNKVTRTTPMASSFSIVNFEHQIFFIQCQITLVSNLPENPQHIAKFSPNLYIFLNYFKTQSNMYTNKDNTTNQDVSVTCLTNALKGTGDMNFNSYC